jgi:hypothetical protein
MDDPDIAHSNGRYERATACPNFYLTVRFPLCGAWAKCPCVNADEASLHRQGQISRR